MIDLFSSHSQQYAEFRPTYPQILYDFIYSHVRSFEIAWDAGTGNGQAARVLSQRFKKVLATDISRKQLEQAFKKDSIFYSVAGEKTEFANDSIDLITVSQAIHWFDLDKFYLEVKRVAKPDALFAVWGYGLLRIDPAIDLLITDFYKNVVGPYWNKQRKLIDEAYQTIPFPFNEIKAPEFGPLVLTEELEMPCSEISLTWTIDQLEGYLTTWSAVQKYIQTNRVNPVKALINQIAPLWKGQSLPVNFPLFLRLGRVNPRKAT
ncbi:MAG: class I SAM-dependent methyltransferase [Flammeovirgaceae bacterium]|nr:class I SAM-dependent methyltransferase [Flammeovirgaceae bacterium]